MVTALVQYILHKEHEKIQLIFHMRLVIHLIIHLTIIF